MQHSGQNDMAIMSRNLRRLGMGLETNGERTIVFKRYWIFNLAIRRTATLREAHIWIKNKANELRGTSPQAM